MVEGAPQCLSAADAGRCVRSGSRSRRHENFVGGKPLNFKFAGFYPATYRLIAVRQSRHAIPGDLKTVWIER